MDPITLDRRFVPWQFGVGHSRLLLRSRARGGDAEQLSVLFTGVRAVKLRTSYEPLELRPADRADRELILDFAEIPDRLRSRYLCLTLPVENAGFVICARATVLAGDADRDPGDRWRSDEARVLHVLTNVPGVRSTAHQPDPAAGRLGP
ncbi:hypothetical protein [Longispora urticae]